MEVKVNALMIRAADYGENDKVLTLLTAERGKITAGIKGVKKAGAKLKFAAQPFCLAEYVLACRSGRYTVIQAAESQSFYELRCDIGKFYAASALCEAANALTSEEEASPEIFVSCVKGLADMCEGDECLALITFLVRILGYAGYGFRAEGCFRCGRDLSKDVRLRFDMQSGRFSCSECCAGAEVSGSTYAVLMAAQGTPCGDVTADGEVRALRLLNAYIALKAEVNLGCLQEYVRLLRSQA